jgi:hypothetical protein
LEWLWTEVWVVVNLFSDFELLNFAIALSS